MNHTPTPYTVRDRSSNPNNGTGWRDILAKSSYDGNDMYIGEALEADAQFIVRACNAHEELVALLKRLVVWESEPDKYTGDLADIAVEARKLLTTIEKGA